MSKALVAPINSGYDLITDFSATAIAYRLAALHFVGGKRIKLIESRSKSQDNSVTRIYTQPVRNDWLFVCGESKTFRFLIQRLYVTGRTVQNFTR